MVTKHDEVCPAHKDMAPRWLLMFLAGLFGALLYIVWSQNDNYASVDRVQGVETRVSTFEHRFDKVEDKLDTVIMELRK